MKRGSLLNAVVILLTGLLLAACGGGGGETGGFGGGGGTGGAEPPAPTISLQLIRVVGGEEVEVDRVDPSNPAIAVATLTNTTGNAVVEFNVSIGQLDPSSGSVLSRDGEARITVEAGTVGGAGEISASASIGGSTINSNSVPFEVLEFEEVVEDLRVGICTGGSSELDCTSPGTTFVEGQISIDLTDSELPEGIPPQGSAPIGVVVVDVSTTPPTPALGVDVSFSSRCTNLDQSSIGASQSSASGVVNAVYQAEGCEGNDNITATIPSTTATASGTIFVFAPGATDIVFDSVQNTAGETIDTIFVRESGGESTARVIFRVLDSFGDPKADVDVRFELTTTIGDLALENDERKSDENGEVVAFVNAGFFPTTVQVQASIDVDQNNDGVPDGTKTTASESLSVNTGVADQDSMSISASTLNVEGEDIDGVTTEITIRLADLANNPVRDGTTVQFRTEYGRVTSSCNTLDGTCSVTWNSQLPRRPLDPNVVVPLLSDADVCPSDLIYEEEVGISGTDGDTGYRLFSVGRVETLADVALVVGVDYTVDEDGSGITCDVASVTCADGETVKISYYREWLDEDVPDGDTDHTISVPGIATAPFTGRTFVPCRAAFREATEEAPAYHSGLGQVYGGRSAVLAFAQGEESFTDSNSNGLYDEGEAFIDLPEAFLDVNEDDVYGNGNPAVDDSSDNDPENWLCYGPAAPLSPNNPPLNRCFQEGGGEDILVDFNQDGMFNAGNGIYNGSLCPKELEDGSPPTFCTRDRVNIRRTITILSAGSAAAIGIRDSSTGEYISAVDISAAGPGAGQFRASQDVIANNGSTILAGTPFTVGFGDGQAPPTIGEFASLTSGSGGVVVDVADFFNGFMPAGTSISVDPDACDISGQTSLTVGSTNGLGFSSIGFFLQAAESPPTDSGTAIVTVQPPNSAASQAALSCSY